MKAKGRGGTGRAYVVGGHGVEMSESGYWISVVAMVWVSMEIVPARYMAGAHRLSTNPTSHTLSAKWQLRPSLTERWRTVSAPPPPSPREVGSPAPCPRTRRSRLS